jgi:hypothetical protein
VIIDRAIRGATRITRLSTSVSTRFKAFNMIFWFGVLTAIVSIALLRKTGGVVRHMFAVAFAAMAVPLLALANFQLFHPLGNQPSHMPRVWEAQQFYIVLTAIATLIGLTVGILWAAYLRRKAS